MSRVAHGKMLYILERCPACKWEKQRPLGRLRTARHCPNCDEYLVKRVFKQADADGAMMVWDESHTEG